MGYTRTSQIFTFKFCHILKVKTDGMTLFEASSSTYFVLQKFVDDVDKRRRDVDEIRAKASELLPQLSQHDTELVEEHIR